ncbi:MAG: dockerin type I repeat-containing protein [Muribaculaceae bacterium]|nr:dockerin type I repeat-containing protein [Muribaculaceae bacterium]
MKKLLLIAAMAALALGANADGYKLEQVWKNTDVASLYMAGVRQGFGMDGLFYINDTQWNGEGESTIYIYGEDGLVATMPGYANSAITRDEAGNLVVMDNTGFAAHTNDDPWPLGASIRVIDLNTSESKEYQIPPDALLSGRCDFLGFPKGNLMEDGEVYLTSGNGRTVFSIIAVAGGELDTDNSYHVDNELTYSTTSTVINFYTDANGDENLLYVTRNSPMVKIPMDDLSGGTKLTLPFRGPSNGAFPFVFDGKEFILYPYKATADVNYVDGFIISEIGAEEPTAIVPATITAPINGYQCNWLNAEVDANGVTIYHYYPGGYIEVWRMTKDGPQAMRGDVDMDGNVGIGDVTNLIDYLLNGTAPVFDAVAADCDLDGNVGIGDVTAIIDFILNGVWPS